MNGFPTHEQVKRIKEQYPAGTRVELISMDDMQAPPPGTKGTVECVDDAGQVHVRWETGSGLALIPGVDSFKTIKD